MVLQCHGASLGGVILVEPQVFEDDRGFFWKPLNRPDTLRKGSFRHLSRTIIPTPAREASGAFITS